MNPSPYVSFPEFAKLAKESVSERITVIFRENRAMFDNLPKMGGWLASEMEDFASSGKMLRGALACAGARLFEGLDEENRRGVASLAAGLELLQAGLLVHDDIMDHDERRRGKPTCHLRIKNRILESKPEFDEALALGMAEAQGTCVGDLFFFIAWEEITRIPSQVSSLISREHAIVTLAQMRDVAMGYDECFPAIDDVIDMYRHKTARYTVALPLLAGASMSGRASKEALSILETFGEALGIVFQLQDDRLGLFGDEQSIGKPVGSDIKEGKKTPYVLVLMDRINDEERTRFHSIYKSPHIDSGDLAWLRGLMMTHGVDAYIQKMIEGQLSKARAALEALSGLHTPRAEAIHLLESFIDYSNQRKS
jgi:geranylgeranyl diphosphate synthase type I